MSEGTERFVCETCGQTHAGLPTDSAFKLPDVVWEIPEAERAAQAKWATDLCKFGDRYFIRCLLEVPFTERVGYYGWGVWAEVSWPTFQKYWDLYDEDATNEPRLEGTLANEIPTYGRTVGLSVLLQFRTAKLRPSIHFAAATEHPLAREAERGISNVRFHEILVARGQAYG